MLRRSFSLHLFVVSCWDLNNPLVFFGVLVHRHPPLLLGIALVALVASSSSASHVCVVRVRQLLRYMVPWLFSFQALGAPSSPSCDNSYQDG